MQHLLQLYIETNQLPGFTAEILTLSSHLCGWCRCGSTRKSVQPHHPHREMRTRRRVPLILIARRPHWKMQPSWEPTYPCRLCFQKKCRDFFPACHGPARLHIYEPGVSLLSPVMDSTVAK
ncbi:unnamed protein product, partial [Staurois parvus]